MARPARPHVVVVGAGPVGLTAAALLAGRGIACTVLERHPSPYGLPRAVHLDDEVQRILQELGLADAFAAVRRPMPGMRLVDGRQRLLVEFSREGLDGVNGHPRAVMFHQPDLEDLLLERVAIDPCISLRRGCTVTAVEGRSAPLRVHFRSPDGDQLLDADAVLGADGTDSTIRSQIGSRLRDLRFEERWLVLDLRIPGGLDVWGGVHQICDPRRPSTFLHVTGERYRWEFRLRDGEDVEELTSGPGLRLLLAPWLTPSAADRVEVVRRTDYTFRARVADRWRAGRVFLLGDAAHQTPPFIGQGLGAGMRDAANLAWKLAAVLDGADERLLDTYERERRAHVTVTTRGAVVVGWALTGGQDRAARARRFVMSVLRRVPGLPALAAGAAAPRLPRSSVLARRRPDPFGVVGRPCPQPTVLTDQGPERLDVLLGPGWSLLTVGDAAALPGVRHLEVDDLVTLRGTDLRTWLRRHRTTAVLVRPDRIVAAYGARARRGELVPA